jgi:hypothetical protein
VSRKLILVVLMFSFSVSIAARDDREQVALPEPMREHMLSNMRDHLLALESITRNLAAGEFDKASETAESRIGMSSMATHGAAHMAPFMPEGMRTIGTAMHRAASRFAIKAKDAAVDGGLADAFGALSDVMQQCVACHSSYRVH